MAGSAWSVGKRQALLCGTGLNSSALGGLAGFVGTAVLLSAGGPAIAQEASTSGAQTTASAGQPADPGRGKQTGPADEKINRAIENQVGEVVVTANRREQNILDVPYSISAVGGASLERRGLTSLSDLSREVSGLTVIDKGPFAGIANNSVIIHGISAENSYGFIGKQTAAAVATYVNDTPLFVNLRLKDIDRVEVLKGPQGTLYGANSLGGTIRIIQNLPQLGVTSGSLASGVATTAHSGDPSYNVDGVFNLPLGDRLAIRINAGYEQTAGFIDQPKLYVLDGNRQPVLAAPGDILNSPPVFTSEKDTNDYRIWSVRGSALWKPTDTVALRLDYNHQEARAGGRPTITPDIYGHDLKSAAYTREQLRDDIDIVSLSGDIDLGFAKLSSTTSYSNHTAYETNDNTRFFQHFSFYTPYYGSGPRPLIDSRSPYSDRNFTQEVRLASKGGGRFDWIIGGYYSQETTEPQIQAYYPGYTDYFTACRPVYGFGSVQCGYGPYTGPATSLNGIPVIKDLAFLSDVKQDFKDVAVFGELTLHVTDKLQLTGGMRYFKQDSSAVEKVGLLFSGPDFVFNTNRKFSDSRPLFKANMAYKFTDEVTAFATFSQGFRRGNVNALPSRLSFGPPIDPGVFSSEPDITDNYEVGVKGRLRQFQFAASAYYIDWKKIQAEISLTPLVILGVVNAGDGYSEGVDLESSFNTRNLLLQINYGYNQSKLESINAAIIASASSTPTPGGNFPGVPEHTISGRAEYALNPDAALDVRLGVSADYRSSQPVTISATSPRLKGYGFVNAYVIVNKGPWTGRLYVNNLFDELGITSSQDPAAAGFGYYQSVSRPRTLGVSLARRF